MSERGRLPRRPIDDRRGYNEVRLVEPKGYPEARVVDERMGYLDTRLVDERRSYPGVRMIDDHRGYSAIRIDDRRAHPDIHEGPRMRGAPHPHPAVLEEELELQEHELRRLLAHNRALAEERADLNRELQAGKDEVRHLNVIISDITAEKEAYINKLVDKKRKLEAELRANEHLRDEVVQLRGEIEKLIAARKELSAEAASLMEDLTRERSVKHQLPMLKAELEGLQQELIHARTACELEQKGNFELVEQRKAMEKNMFSMAQEIEQMRAELAKCEVRPWGTGGTYGMQMGSPEVTFTKSYEDGYNIHAGVSEKGPLHPPESSSWGTYDKNRLQYR
ncbi:protein FLX-like 3 [Panicum miliaceum]|uniref:Protein FLX-like 3 n=1 Tax=Panicum miliaceum TaxID=4540 RepID=A0A3L6R7A7_PANMI|nr:protein FLX-like 3 [Panicum miliaceum]